MKYAHLADLHLGAWRDEKMRALSTKSFLIAIDQCIEKQVDFVLFAGDLFNTSLPALDTLKIVTKKLKELKDKNIPLYVIAGSHDFSPSGKTMIDVLENAGLLINVCRGNINPDTKELHLRFTQDPKTKTKITGLIGRKGQLDRAFYETLHRTSLEQEPGYKIFMFHTTIAEMLPKEMAIIESCPLSFLPKGFNYYAGGHIHHPTKISQEGYNCVTYPGALFPNNFQEIEKYSKGGYYLISVEDNHQQEEWVPLEVIKHKSLILNCKHKNPEQIKNEIINHFQEDLADTIVTIRLKGTLDNGKTTDIDFKEILKNLYQKGAYFVMRNISKLQSEEFEEIKISYDNPEIMEEEIIKEHLQQMNTFTKDKELDLTKSLIKSFNTTKREGETTTDFEKRFLEEAEQLIGFKNE